VEIIGMICREFQTAIDKSSFEVLRLWDGKRLKGVVMIA
jgi:hypothetical protein